MMLKEQIAVNSDITESKLEKVFEKYKGKKYELVTSAMQYSISAGGKRIRPFLLIEFYKLCGGQTPEKISNFAAAIEMIHTYSLIHDDLPCMDNDDLRRGKPSCHKKFGEGAALLAGDGLLTLAFETALDFDGSVNANCALRAVYELSKKAGISGMVGGQTIDVISEGKEIDEETLSEIHLLKTSALISAACKMGAILACANEEEIKWAEKYGEKLGLAFQIIDDVLDAVSTVEKLGKPIGSDLDRRKTTYYSLYGEDGALRKAEKLTNEAIAILNLYKNNSNPLVLFTKNLLEREG